MNEPTYSEQSKYLAEQIAEVVADYGPMLPVRVVEQIEELIGQVLDPAIEAIEESRDFVDGYSFPGIECEPAFIRALDLAAANINACKP